MSKTSNSNGGLTGKWNLLTKIVEWILDFLGKHFPEMPKWARISVYLGTYTVFLIIVGALVYAIFFPAPEGDIEIVGRLTGRTRAALRDTHIVRDLSAENLFVYKKPDAVPSRFTYEWILKVKRNKMNTPLGFAISQYDTVSKKPQPLCEAMFTPEELLDNGVEGTTSLEVDEYFTSLKMVRKTGVPGGVRPFGFVPLVNTVFAEAKAQSKSSRQYKVLTRDSADLLLKEFRSAKNPVAQMQIRAELSYADEAFTVQLAESLKSAVLRGRDNDIPSYARLLANSDRIGSLTSSGEHRDVFDAIFYAKAVSLFHTGKEYQSRSVASLLRALQDGRTLKHLYNEFEHTQSPLAKSLCLNVLEAFSKNSSREVRKQVERKLMEFKAKESSEEIRGAIDETLAAFRVRGRTGD